MPSDVPANTNGWWCDPSGEYAFLGFSYEVTACQSLSQLQREFADIRNNFNGRYVRLYGACDGREGFYDDVITAAWDNNLGVHALIWFGFDGSDQWKTRRDKLFATLHSNPKAKFVTRVVQFGSEPLFDGVISPSELAAQVYSAKQALSDIDIPITVSELAYGYQIRGGAQDVLDAIDSINIHMLPFFARSASSGDQAWHLVQKDLGFFIENEWLAIRPVGERATAKWSRDRQCKHRIGGGIGWFAHVYADDQEPGYGIYTASRKPKFPFAPKTYC
ncbi:hypothetical protein B0F90DRAFT_1815321 [Multifurca ochricompacta]|uniref:glucan endo-1,3-beta-D-glucosidase n=1 Tax=Multifurca ochricompacta TaxID=376703 RepID=A0AAD4QND6_9AGAM|nr:hypothetical protein B0F90DRAFT_1815321 [Multifurca ochricompacta]